METIYVENGAGMSCVGDDLAVRAVTKVGAVRVMHGDRIPAGSLRVYRTNEKGGWFGVARSGVLGRICRFRNFDRALSAALQIATA
ncbi:hypothetical protein [Achromobacter denitrificans]|uniref:hypothetical protein n=1 Tax=Achromobacter denitrificans TaxID=32002 RepID=UPI0023E86E4B|nr:hypothetical protein [Achromobacter denitrificans]MDF3851384.1 hypothetical protein [Achromobacter denitrificans]MDF3940740.1 hypothetical protein [Achromobacter denitrificans]